MAVDSVHTSTLLGQVAKIIMGQSPPGSTYNERGEGFPFYQGVADFGFRYPSRRVYCSAPTRFAEKGDILLSVRAPIGRVNRASEKCAIGRGLAGLRGETELDTTYIELLLRASVDLWATLEGQGSVFGNAKKEDLESLPLIWPDRSIRHAIAYVLGTLDDKIDLNQRMNETLEVLARSIFKSWFVDFDPVRAKMDGRWKKGQSLPGLPAHLWDLFPDRLVDSELGEIPEGWEVKPLPEVIEVNPSRTLRKGDVAPYLDMANMPTRGHSPDAFIDRPFGSGMRFINGDTLVARITPCLENGKTAFVDFLRDGQIGWGSTEYIVLRPKPPLPPEFGYCLARSDDFRDFAIQSMTGSSGRQRVPPGSLIHFQLASPSTGVAQVFGRFVEPLFARAGAATKESRTLAALRDTLLPKLISGKLRVKDAEKFVEKTL